jgi:hypothetical protein
MPCLSPPVGFQNSAASADLGLLCGPFVFAGEVPADGSAVDRHLAEISDGRAGRAELTAAMRRLGHVARHEPDDVRAEHCRTAGEEADSKCVTVNACLLDCRLPGDEPSEGRPASGRSPRQAKQPSAADAQVNMLVASLRGRSP